MGVQSVKIPVELQVQQIEGQITELKKALKGVKPETAAWSKINASITKLEEKMAIFARHSKQSFSSVKEVKIFEREISQMGESIQRVVDQFKGLSFKDLKFDSGISEEIQAIEKQIKDLKVEMNSAEEKAVKGHIDSLVGSKNRELFESKNIKTYDALLKNLIKTRQKYNEEIEKNRQEEEKLFEESDRLLSLVRGASQENFQSRKTTIDNEEEAYPEEKKPRGHVLPSRRKRVFQESELEFTFDSQIDVQEEFDDYVDEIEEDFEAAKKEGRTFTLFDKDNFINEDASTPIEDLFNKYNEEVNFEKGKLKKNIAQALFFDLENLGLQKKDFEPLFSGVNFTDFEESFNALKKQILQRSRNLSDKAWQLNFDRKLKEGSVEYWEGEITSVEEEQKLNLGSNEEYKQQIAELEEKLKKLRKEQAAASSAVRTAEKVAENTSQAHAELAIQTEKAKNQLAAIGKIDTTIAGIENAVKKWFGFNEVINLTKRIVQGAINEIRELDKVMTEIAVVTDMTQKDLWAQMDTYGAIAEQYGVSTRGVYQVSQLWYQQGLQTNEVMNLTTETLKMAKIANLDYSTATDYMTVALRGFKLEMSNAQNVTDVYSALAAATASDTEELAIAMSKTASSAEAVGASFESTSAMIATMISITREAPENIGSALKSIISRYGEMTSDPLKLIDSEGEEMSLNKVDKALRSVGISLQDSNGQFRDFDDVILELAESWNTIDTNTQRYIATIMAGNRQQSRFLSLVGNVDAYKDALETAANAEDAGTLQYLKTMDSLETKLQQVQTAWTQFYASMGIEDLFKGALDIVTSILQKFNSMGKPQAFVTILNLFTSAKRIVDLILKNVSKKTSSIIGNLQKSINSLEKGTDLQLKTDEVESQLEELHKKAQQAFTVELKVVEEKQPEAKIPENTIQPESQIPLTPQKKDTLRKEQYDSDKADLRRLSEIAKAISKSPLTNKDSKTSKNRGLFTNLSSSASLTKELKLSESDLALYNKMVEQSGIKFQNAQQFIGDFNKYIKKQNVELNKNNIGNKLKIAEEKFSERISNLGAKLSKNLDKISYAFSAAGTALTAWSLTIKDSSDSDTEWSKVAGGFGNVLSSVGNAAAIGTSIGGPWGAVIGTVVGIATSIPGIAQIVDGASVTIKERINMLQGELNELQETATVKKGEVLNLQNTFNELQDLEEAQYDSAEAAQAYTDKMNELGEQYPQLIESIDSMGNVTIDTVEAENMLAKARAEAAKATLDASNKEYDLKAEELKLARENANYVDSIESATIDVRRNTVTQATAKTFIGQNSFTAKDYANIIFAKQIANSSVLEGLNKENIINQVELAMSGNSEAIDWFVEQFNQIGNDLEIGSLTYEDFAYDEIKGEVRAIISTDASNSIYGLKEQSSGEVEEEDEIKVETVKSLREIDLEDLYNDTEGQFSQVLDNTIKFAEKLGVSVEDLGYILPENDESFDAYNITDKNKEDLYNVLQTLIEIADQRVAEAEEAVLNQAFSNERDIFSNRLAQKATRDISLGNSLNQYGSMLSFLGASMVEEILNVEKAEDFNIQDFKEKNQEAYDEAFSISYESIENLALMPEKDLKSLSEFYDSMKNLRSKEDIGQSLYKLGIIQDLDDPLIKAFEGLYEQFTEKARERIEKAAENYNISDTLKSISQVSFNETGVRELSIQYADHFSATMKQIDLFTKEGFETKAKVLDQTAVELYSSLGFLNDNIQNDLSSIITNINWTDSASLQGAIEEITKYQSEKNFGENTVEAREIKDIIETLNYAKDTLAFNLQTELQIYRDAIIDSVEKTSETVSGFTEGFDLKEAITKLDALQAVEGFEDKTFDDLFFYDKALGKYVYSIEGFNAAIATQEKELTDRETAINTEIEQLEGINLADLGLLTFRNTNWLAEQEYNSSEELAKLIVGSDRWQYLDETTRGLLTEVYANYNPKAEGASTPKEYFSQYLEDLDKTQTEIDILYAQLQNETIRTLKNSLNYEILMAGITEDSHQAELLRTLGKELGKEDIVERIISGQLEIFKGLNELLGDSFTYEDRADILENNINTFNSAVSKTLEGPGIILTETEGKILERLGLAKKNQETGIYRTIEEIDNYFNLIKEITSDSFLGTIQEANEQLAKIYEKRRQEEFGPTDFISKTSLNYDDLSKLATAQNQKLNEFLINIASEDILKQNQFTGEYEVIDFEAYWDKISGGVNKNAAEYLEAYSKWTEEQISKNSQIKEGVQKEIENLMEAKIGDQLSVVYLESIIGNLEEFLPGIENGILEVTDTSQIYGLIKTIIDTESIGSSEFADSIVDLKDSLADMFASWTDLINKGLEGELKHSDKETLMTQFEGVLEEKHFVETAKGLQLSYQAAALLQTELNKIDPEKARLSISQIAETLTETNREYKDYYSTLKSVEDLEEKIEKINQTADNDPRLKGLQAELDLAKEILKIRSTEPESFNFMDRDIPEAFTNPLSAWDGINSAMEVLNGENFKQGYIDFKDFYNMINMMESAGVDLSTVATNFEGEAVTASQLIQAAGASLTSVDGNTFIDLGKLGETFKINAEEMGVGLDKGIQIIAENQIKVLDSAIMILETIVAMEEIGNLDENKDNSLNKNELFNSEGLLKEEVRDALGAAKTNLEKLGIEVEGVYLGTISLKDLLEGNIESITGTEDKAEEYVNLINSLLLAFSEKNFDPNNPYKVLELLSNYGLTTYYKLDPSANDETGLFWYKGKEYEGIEAVQAAIAEDNLTALGGGKFVELTPEDETEGIIIKQQYGEMTIECYLQEGKMIYRTSGGGEGTTPEEAITDEYNQEVSRLASSGLEFLSEDEWRLSVGYPVKTVINPQQAEKVDIVNVKAAKGAIKEDLIKIQEMIDNGEISSDIEPEFLTKYGITLEPGTELSPEQIAELKTAFGIEDKTINLAINAESVDAEIYNLLSGAATDIPATIVLEIENGENIQITLGAIKDTLTQLEAQGYNINLTYSIASTSSEEGTYSVEFDDQGTVETLTNLATALTKLNTQASALAEAANSIKEDGPNRVESLKTQMNNLDDKSEEVKNTALAIEKLESKSITASITVDITAPNPTSDSTTRTKVNLTSSAKGNVALAKGANSTSVKGKTLMGELGPELVVSNGHYFTVGNNGAEFVDLPEDAIVFNHLQTKKLLGAGGTVGTGQPITNERNAVAFANGNVSGSAMASAKQTLDELKTIRAMWQGLIDLNASELSKKAGSGGGGGGGGEGDKASLHDLERWYNLLRQIEKLEQQITHEQAKRENMRSGFDRNKSLEKELALLEKQRKANEELATLQKNYYKERQAILNSTDYSKIFTYDDDGLMQYVEGEGKGLDILATLNATDTNGKALYTSKQQLQLLKNYGFDTSILKTNADGTKAAKADEQMQNFWDGIDSWMEEMDSLYDSYNDAATAMEEATSAMSEILKEQIENQLTVEEKLMKALEAREQAEIDKIQEEKDALEKAAQEYIDGLSSALEKERSMYDKNETDMETARLQRQLAILQRSGGSASEIKSLQDQIDSRLKDAYFEEQQNQIDAIQEASDNQLEKLQIQIDIMTETLEYQKENGLLWNEVYEMMQIWTPEAMMEFIEKFDSEYKTNSTTQNQQNTEETLQQIEQWVGYKQYQKKKELEAPVETETKILETEEENKTEETQKEEKKKIKFNRGKEQYYTYGTSDKKNKGQIFEGNGKSPFVEVISETDSMYQISGKDGKGKLFTNRWISKKTSKGKDIWKAYKTGGLVDYTGPAWVDGSKKKPEAFLSASDTAMLKSKIFSNSDGSLKALVAALEAITRDTSKYSAAAPTESIIIQNAQVNIQPGTISNDYDARRAGEMALEEMVKIARKTTNRVVSR